MKDGKIAALREGSMTHFVETHYDELVDRCRKKVAARLVPMPTEVELEHGIPMFLRQLADRLAEKISSKGEISATAVKHGGEMHVGGFTIAQVVHDYGDACQAITELAIERRVPIATEDFRALNECLDNAIADAVTEFSRRRDIAVTAEGTDLANERLGTLAHELHNLLYAAMISFEALKCGGVGVRGSTGALVSRSMIGMRDLLTNTLSDVRLTAGIETREPIAVREFAEEIEVAALMEAKARGLRFAVTLVPVDVVVEGDRQILVSVVSNLVQNALKFTRPESEITLRTRATATRVLIEVEDACGGLPKGAAEQMFRAFGEQKGRDKSGVGLGLSISRRGAQSLGANLSVRDVPGKGCVFTLDLPRRLVP
jgi:signal transduction histidine kinase